MSENKVVNVGERLYKQITMLSHYLVVLLKHHQFLLLLLLSPHLNR